MPDGDRIVWRSPEGEIISCAEKIKVLGENLEEIRELCQDALDDAVLMGCDDQQVREVFAAMIASLSSAYSGRDRS